MCLRFQYEVLVDFLVSIIIIINFLYGNIVGYNFLFSVTACTITTGIDFLADRVLGYNFLLVISIKYYTSCLLLLL